MRRYLSLYRTLLRFSFMNFTVYPANFINGSISTVGWGIFQIISIRLLTLRTESAFGWNRDELTLLAVMYTVIIGMFHFLFTRNFDRFSRIIDRGELDFMLLKPVDSQFLATCFMQGMPNLLRVSIGSAILIGYTLYAGIRITPLGAFGLIVFSVFSLMMLYSLWLLYTTTLVWFPRLTNIIDFLYTINGMGRYPVEMVRELRNFVLFFLLPFSLTVATPLKVFLRSALDGDVLLLVVISLVLFAASRMFWKFALRHYTSASS
jgi:ABC-2 type transport system permease protein